MDAHRRLDQNIRHIEEDDRMDEDEKAAAIHEEEMAFGEHMEQFEAEKEALERQYGF